MDDRAGFEAAYLYVGLWPHQQIVVRLACQVMYAGTSTETKLEHARRHLGKARAALSVDPPLLPEALTATLVADELADMARFERAGIGRG